VSDEQTMRRDLRETRRLLRDLTRTVDRALSILDAEMRGPSTVERGERVAAIANGLDLQNQIAKRFGVRRAARSSRGGAGEG
jgi:hypothetical protein